MCLCDKQAGSGDTVNERGVWSVEQCYHILEPYGVDRFITDIEATRQFWRDGEHVVSEIFDYCTGLGFTELFLDTGVNVKTAAQLRELLKCKPPGVF